MSATADRSGRARPTTRTWLVLGAAAVAAVVSTALVGFALSPRSDG